MDRARLLFQCSLFADLKLPRKTRQASFSPHPLRAMPGFLLEHLLLTKAYRFCRSLMLALAALYVAMVAMNAAQYRGYSALALPTSIVPNSG
jgi:hypothetical protein